MDYKNLHSRFEKSHWEPNTADDAWKRLHGDKPFSLDNLDFQERLATAKAWRQESIKLAQEEATREQRQLSATQRRELITDLCNKNKSQLLNKGERDMHDTINLSNANISFNYNEKTTTGEKSESPTNQEQLKEEQRQEDQQRDQEQQEEQQRDEQQQQEQQRDEQQQQEQQRDAQQQQEQQHDDQQQQEQLRNQQHRQEQERDEQQQQEQQRDAQQQQEQQRDEQRQQEQQQEETRQEDAKEREADDRAYDEAEARYKQLDDMERSRQMENRLGPTSQDSILARFLDFLEKDKREQESENHGSESEHQEEYFERPSYNDNIPDHGLGWGDIDHHDDFAHIEELLNSFDRSLDVEKDIDLSVYDPTLIDEVDKYFNIDRDVEMNWSLDNKATGQELNLDKLLDDLQLDEGTAFQAEKFDRILYGQERSLELSVHEKSEIEQRIDSWQDYAFDPILIHEQNGREALSDQEIAHEEIGASTSAEHSQIQQQNLDQFMQQQVQQNMQSQIQQTFMSSPHRSDDHGVLDHPQTDRQIPGRERDDEGREHAR